MANFKVHARVLDLLGEEQIADCPTAMSELFKNSYDAYASKVSLDVYKEQDLAVLWDDGIGMSNEDVLSRWLVVGTPGKKNSSSKSAAPDGSIPRPIMGEKGIGRLAISTLGDNLFIITKKTINGKEFYTALLINWNIVRNDRLLLSDIDVPVKTFNSILDLEAGLADEMVQEFLAPILAKENDKLWNDGYENYRNIIKSQLDSFILNITTIKRTGIEKQANGTLFYISNLAPDLPIYVTPPNRNDSDKDSPQALLVQLLASFQKRDHNSFPSLEPDSAISFRADVRTWDEASTTFRSVFDDWNTFNEDDLSGSDHCIKINFDGTGRYSGSIRRYDEIIKIPLSMKSSALDVSCGPFSLEFWYWQGEGGSSKLSADQKTNIDGKLKLFGGVLLYRDGLRVLPYGRPEFDWLKMEERRSLKASKAFFSYRRMFGSVSITRDANPLLRDKAGREGLKSNKEYRDFRKIIINFLTEIAREYFGESSEFKQKKAEIEAHNEILIKEQNKVSNRRKKLTKDLTIRIDKMINGEDLLRNLFDSSINKLVRYSEKNDAGNIIQINIDFERRIANIEDEIRFVIPGNLSLGKNGDLRKLKHNYEDALPKFRSLCTSIRNEFAAAVNSKMPNVAASSLRKRSIENSLLKGRTKIGRAYAEAKSNFEQAVEIFDSIYDEKKRNHLSGLENKLLDLTHTQEISSAQISMLGEISQISSALDNLSAEAEAEISEYSDRLIDHLNIFAEGDDNVVAAQSDEIEELKEQVSQNLELVQLGLSVEIIDHDLQKAYRGIKGNISKLQQLLRSAPKSLVLLFELKANFQHLEQRYQLMSPLYRNSYRRKSDITGKKIFEYVSMFLHHELSTHDIRLEATDEFLNIEMHEVAGRILPVFINVIDNAIYWLRDSNERIIRLDFVNEVITICDSGSGIHPAMIKNVFKPFISGKPSGRGLGLHIARANLELANHEIWAELNAPYRTLAGACICIRLNKKELKLEF